MPKNICLDIFFYLDLFGTRVWDEAIKTSIKWRPFWAPSGIFEILETSKPFEYPFTSFIVPQNIC